MNEQQIEKVINYVNKLSWKHRNKDISKDEECFLRGISMNMTYSEMFNHMPPNGNNENNHHFECTLNTLTTNTSKRFFEFLGSALGKNINKANAKAVIITKMKAEGYYVDSDFDTPSCQGYKAESRDKHYYLQHTINLILKKFDDNPITEENLSTRLYVQPGNLNTMEELFGLINSNYGVNEDLTLAGLFNNLPEQSLLALEDIVKVISSLIKGRKPKEIQSTFMTSDAKLYMPMVHRTNDLNSLVNRFKVIFRQHTNKEFVDNPRNPAVTTLTTAFILGSRLQNEVCDKFLSKLDSLQQEDLTKVIRMMREIKNSVSNIDTDAEVRRRAEASDQRNADRLRNSFKSENDREIIRQNLLEQERYKNILRRANTCDKIDDVRDALTKLRSLNKIVMHMILNELRLYYKPDEDSP